MKRAQAKACGYRGGEALDEILHFVPTKAITSVQDDAPASTRNSKLFNGWAGTRDFRPETRNYFFRLRTPYSELFFSVFPTMAWHASRIAGEMVLLRARSAMSVERSLRMRNWAMNTGVAEFKTRVLRTS